MIKARILIIDDNKQILESVKLLLKDEFTDIDALPSPSRLREMLWKNEYDVILLDMNFIKGETSGNEGLFWLDEIKKIDPYLPVILITAYGDIELAVKTIQKGATDFIAKPWDPEKLILTIKNIYKLRRSNIEVRKLRNNQNQLKEDIEKDFRLFHTSSAIMNSIMKVVEKVASTEINVLILGENGTGKELIAREIHRRSSRKHNIFVSVDVASLSENLFESEMFGHIKGAFTGAIDDRTGRFETANEGTLFLDEVGNIPFPLQAKLLHAIQNKVITRVGDNRPINIDIQLISATNMPLEQMVKDKTFREDLYYRLNTITIKLPALRERENDIFELASYFTGLYSKKYNKENIRLGNSAMKLLQNYSWPGNIRELKHCIERAVILSEDNILSSDDLQLSKSGLLSPKIFQRLEDVEKNTIMRTLEKCNGNYSKAAKVLDISRTTLYSKIQKYGI